MNAGRTPAWAISFADLCLLLLGFFVMLHAVSGQQKQLVVGINQAFGSGNVRPIESREMTPARMFHAGEAVLKDDARIQLTAIGHHARDTHARVSIESVGTDPATNRFDGWELAAARTASIARTIKAAGVPERDIDIAIPGMTNAPGQHRQRIAIELTPAP